MKKAIAALLLGTSLSAMAAGPFDGLYQSTSNEKSFILVQQSGPMVLAANYYAIPSSEIVYMIGGQSFVPPQMYVWDAYMGPITGTDGVVTGLAAMGACNVTQRLFVDGHTLNWSVVKAEQTALGMSQGVQCSWIFNGISGKAKRVF